jgi:hypothetical protein
MDTTTVKEDFNVQVQVTVYASPILTTWEPRDFVVVYQPEAWRLKDFDDAIRCGLLLQHPPKRPPEIFVSPLYPSIKFKFVVVDP